MRSSKAPDGYHTTVRITVRLANGATHTYLWDTPMGLAQTASKSLGWAKTEMHKEHVKGRSHIHGFTVAVHYLPGDYENS